MTLARAEARDSVLADLEFPERASFVSEEPSTAVGFPPEAGPFLGRKQVLGLFFNPADALIALVPRTRTMALKLFGVPLRKPQALGRVAKDLWVSIPDFVLKESGLNNISALGIANLGTHWVLFDRNRYTSLASLGELGFANRSSQKKSLRIRIPPALFPKIKNENYAILFFPEGSEVFYLLPGSDIDAIAREDRKRFGEFSNDEEWQNFVTWLGSQSRQVVLIHRSREISIESKWFQKAGFNPRQLGMGAQGNRLVLFDWQKYQRAIAGSDSGPQDLSQVSRAEMRLGDGFKSSEKGKRKTGVSRWDVYAIFKQQLQMLPPGVVESLRTVKDLGEYKRILTSAGVDAASQIDGKFLVRGVQELLESRKPPVSVLRGNPHLRWGGEGRYLVAYVNDDFDFIMKTYHADRPVKKTVQVKWIEEGFSLAYERLGGLAAPSMVFDTDSGQKELDYLIENGVRKKTDLAIIQSKIIPLIDYLKVLVRDGKLEDAQECLDKYKTVITQMFRRGVVDEDFGGTLANYGVDPRTSRVYIFDFGDLSAGFDQAYELVDYLEVVNQFIEDGLRSHVSEVLADYYRNHSLRQEDFYNGKGKLLFGIDFDHARPEAFRMSFPHGEEEIRAMFFNHSSRQYEISDIRSEARDSGDRADPVKPLIFMRQFDLAVVPALMVLVFPVFISAMILLKMATRLSIFYPQERAGFRGKLFKVYKLRTLEADGKTPIRLGKIPLGKILRMAAIDEIPQLWNVLAGEMSVFGPRPRIWSEVDQSPEYLEKVLGRRIPGFLSLLKSEIGAGKGLGLPEIPYEIIFNEFEIGHWSWILMVKIAVKTFRVLLRDTVFAGDFPSEKVVAKIRAQSKKFATEKTEKSTQAERSELRQKPVSGQMAGQGHLVQETENAVFSPRPELWDFQFEMAGHPWSYLLDVLGFRPLAGQVRIVSGAMDVSIDPERAWILEDLGRLDMEIEDERVAQIIFKNGLPDTFGFSGDTVISAGDWIHKLESSLWRNQPLYHFHSVYESRGFESSEFRRHLMGIVKNRKTRQQVTEKILVIGPGMGHELLTLLDEFPESDFYAADINPLAVANTRANVALAGRLGLKTEKVRVVEGDVFSSPVVKDAGIFDLIVFNAPLLDWDPNVSLDDVAVFSSGLDTFLEECANYLTSSGAVILGMDNVLTGFQGLRVFDPYGLEAVEEPRPTTRTGDRSVFHFKRSDSVTAPGRKDEENSPRSEVRSGHSSTKQSLPDLFPRMLKLMDERRRVVKTQLAWVPAVVVFGSARIPRGHPYYQKAVDLGKAMWASDFVPRTGAGPSIMEAVLEGYRDARQSEGVPPTSHNQTQGVKIELPYETEMNGATEQAVFYDRFITRKLALHENIYGAIAMPGGFGTLDEVFEVWRRGRPVVLIGKDFWEPVIQTWYESWERAGLTARVDLRPTHPYITDDIPKALRYIEDYSNRVVYKTDRYNLRRILKNLKHNLIRLRQMPRAVTLVGRPMEGSKELVIAEQLAHRLGEKVKIPVRVASRNLLLHRVFENAETHGWLDLLQAVLFYPASNPSKTPAEKSLGKRLIRVNDESNHQFLTTNNSYAYVFFPGGVGTMNKLFDILQIMQTDKGPRKPIILVGRSFWQPIKDALVRVMLQPAGQLSLIAPYDPDLLRIVDSEEDAWVELNGYVPVPIGQAKNIAPMARDFLSRSRAFSGRKIKELRIFSTSGHRVETIPVPAQIHGKTMGEDAFGNWVVHRVGNLDEGISGEMYLEKDGAALVLVLKNFAAGLKSGVSGATRSETRTSDLDLPLRLRLLAKWNTMVHTQEIRILKVTSDTFLVKTPFRQHEFYLTQAAGQVPASLADVPTAEGLVEDLAKGTEEEKIYAAQELGELGDPEAIPHLVRALEWDASLWWITEKIKAPVELQKAIIKSLAKLKRMPVRMRENIDASPSIVGMIMSSINELGIPRDKVRVCGPHDRIRIMFDIEGSPKEKMNRLEGELRKKFAEANVGCNFERPDGETIEVILKLNVANLTAFWRVLGTMDLRVDDAGNYRKFTNVEMIEKVMQRVQMLLDGIELDMKKVDPKSDEYARMYQEYSSLKFFINGDGTDVNLGLVNIMRHPEELRVPSERDKDKIVKTADGREFVTYGDSQLILTESVKDREDHWSYTSLNEMIQMTEANPYFVKYLDDYPGAEGVKKFIYLARAAGSMFQAKFLRDLMFGKKSDDHMFFISRDTMGRRYAELSSYVADLATPPFSRDKDDEEDVQDFSDLQRLAKEKIASLDREDPYWRKVFDGIWQQLLASGIIEGVKPGEKIMVIDEVANGTYDFIFKHVVETRSFDADKQRFEKEVQALEKKGFPRETAERLVPPPAPIEVGIFIGKSRFDVPGSPDMDAEKLSAMLGIKYQRSKNVTHLVSHGAGFMPHPVKVDDTVNPPHTGPDVPMLLEKNEVLIFSYLKALLGVNGTIDFYDNIAFNAISDTLEKSDDLSVRVAAAKALAEFDIPEQMQKALGTLNVAAKEPHKKLRAAALSSIWRIIFNQLKASREVTGPSATIGGLKDIASLDMSMEEYALKIVPWVEEGIFFALPLVVSSWLFGLGSIGTIAVMAAARTVFFFTHKGARPHAVPATESRKPGDKLQPQDQVDPIKATANPSQKNKVENRSELRWKDVMTSGSSPVSSGRLWLARLQWKIHDFLLWNVFGKVYFRWLAHSRVRTADELCVYLDGLVKAIGQRTGNRVTLADILENPPMYQKIFYWPLYRLFFEKLPQDFDGTESFLTWAESTLNAGGPEALRQALNAGQDSDPSMVSRISRIALRGLGEQASVEFYGFILVFLTQNPGFLLDSIYDLIMSTKPSLQIGREGISYHARAESTLRLYDKAILFASPEAEEKYRSVRDGILERNTLSDRRQSSQAELIQAALERWEAQAGRPGFEFLKRRISNFKKDSVVVGLDSPVPFMIGDPDRNIIRVLHNERLSAAFNFSSEYLESLDPGNPEDVAELATWMNVGQSWLDMYSQKISESSLDPEDQYEVVERARIRINLDFFDTEDGEMMEMSRLRDRLAARMKMGVIKRYQVILPQSFIAEKRAEEELELALRERSLNHAAEALDLFRHLFYRYLAVGMNIHATNIFKKFVYAVSLVQDYDQGGVLPFFEQIDLIFTALRSGLWRHFLNELDILLTARSSSLRRIKNKIFRDGIRPGYPRKWSSANVQQVEGLLDVENVGKRFIEKKIKQGLTTQLLASFPGTVDHEQIRQYVQKAQKMLAGYYSKPPDPLDFPSVQDQKKEQGESRAELRVQTTTERESAVSQAGLFVDKEREPDASPFSGDIPPAATVRSGQRFPKVDIPEMKSVSLATEPSLESQNTELQNSDLFSQNLSANELRSENRVAVDVAEGVFRPASVLKMGQAGLSSVLSALMPTVYANESFLPSREHVPGPTPFLLSDPSRLETGHEQIVVIFDERPSPGDPVLETLLEVMSKSRFLSFQIVIPGLSRDERSSFEKKLLRELRQKCKGEPSGNFNVAVEEARIAGFVGCNSENLLVYDMRENGRETLRRIAPKVTRAGRGKGVLFVYNDSAMVLSQKSLALLAAIDALLEKHLPEKIQPASAILAFIDEMKTRTMSFQAVSSAA